MKNYHAIQKTTLLILISLSAGWIISFSQFSQIQPDGKGGWTQLESMSTSRLFHASCYLDGKIYTTGGYDESDNLLGNCEVYTISDNHWSERAHMKEIRMCHTMETLNDKIYAIGGTAYLPPIYTNVEEYDPYNDEWTKLDFTPVWCWNHSSCVYNNKIYVMGGYDMNSRAKDSCYIYDPGVDTWNSMSPMHYKRSHAACDIYDDKIYIFGGITVFDPASKTNKAEVYDPATDTWEDVANMPEPMMAHIAISVEEDSAIILMFLNHMYAYYPLKDEYVRMRDAPISRAISSAIRFNRHIFVIGGGDREWGTPMSEVWRFNLDSLQPYVNPVSIDNQKAESSNFSLQQISPNPLVEFAEISYELNTPGEVHLEIYNCLGKCMAILVDQKQVSGTYHVTWNAQGIVPGIYFCKLKVNDYGQTQKLIKSR